MLATVLRCPYSRVKVLGYQSVPLRDLREKLTYLRYDGLLGIKFWSALLMVIRPVLKTGAPSGWAFDSPALLHFAIEANTVSRGSL